MRERPILFSAPMVRAIRAGGKTQTRRILKGSTEHKGPYNPAYLEVHRRDKGWASICPYGSPGDRLWVREQLKRTVKGQWVYAVDNTPVVVDQANQTAMITWAHHKNQDYCPSIHMPRWASRITLEITGVRVERLNEISEADAVAEGLPRASGDGGGPGAGFKWKGLGFCDTVSKHSVTRERTYHVANKDGTCRCVLNGPGPARCAFRVLFESIYGPGSFDSRWAWVIDFRRLEGGLA